jgi:hypothetical protein
MNAIKQQAEPTNSATQHSPKGAATTMHRPVEPTRVQTLWNTQRIPAGYSRVSWASRCLAGGRTRRRHSHKRSERQGTASNAIRSPKHGHPRRILDKDRLDRSTTGEFPSIVPRSPIPPGRCEAHPARQVFGPQRLLRTRARSSLANMVSIMQRKPPTPSVPPFHFGVTPMTYSTTLGS